MNTLTKILIVTQTVTLAVLAFALVKVYEPVGEDELKKSRFYAEGKSYAALMRNPATASDLPTCAAALEYAQERDWRGDLKNVTDEDKEAFLAGCKAR